MTKYFYIIFIFCSTFIYSQEFDNSSIDFDGDGIPNSFDLDDDNLLPITTRTATGTPPTGTEEDDDNEGEEIVVLPPIYNTTYLTGAG